jgi:hypothetical protein
MKNMHRKLSTSLWIEPGLFGLAGALGAHVHGFRLRTPSLPDTEKTSLTGYHTVYAVPYVPYLLTSTVPCIM